MKNFIFKIDHKIAELFHELYLWGGDIANYIMEGISFIAEAGILFLLVGFGLALFKRTRKIGGTILCAVALGFILTNVLLKNIIERARPFEDIYSDFYRWWLGAGASHEGGYSFPSGHTTATTSFAVAIFLTTNKKYSWPILTLPLLMACSRIYLMVHYFSDCIGGLIVGSICAILAYFIVKFIYNSNLKICIWIRELVIFKHKHKSHTPSPKTQPKEVINEQSDYVYTTQAEEKIQNSEKSSDTTQETSKEEQSKPKDQS